MKSTPLTNVHIKLGARMAEFAGYHMPISYAGINEEHKAVRENAGVFDVSHMGEFFVEGPRALDLLQRVSSNDVSKLFPGRAQYSCMPNKEGGIVDDLIIYRLPDERSQSGGHAYMLVVNAANIQKDWDWITRHEGYEVKMTDRSDEMGLLAVQGPNAAKVLQQLTDVDLSEIKFYHFTIGELAGLPDVIISATGYTGAGGFELYARADQMVELWNAIFEAGKDIGIVPVGLGARDTLRLEMGYCLYGNDIDDQTSPLEAGLGWITKLQKGPFNSRELFLAQKEEGVDKKLVGFEVLERRVPRKDYKILDEGGVEIGRVTSGTQSPSLGIPIGMGYVKKEFAAPDTSIFIVAGKKQIPAKVVHPPFLKD